MNLSVNYTTRKDFNISRQNHCYTEHCYKVYWDIAKWLTVVEFVSAVILNSAIIVLLLRKGKRNKMTFFVLHLAISDFLVSVFFILPSMLDRLIDSSWVGGDPLCKLVMFASKTVCYGSTYLLVVLSFDRVFAIVCPLSAARRNTWYSKLLVLVAWMMAALLSTPDFLWAETYNDFEEPIKVLCEVIYPMEMREFGVMLFAVMNTFLPAFLIACCYLVMVYVLWKRSQKGMDLNKNKNGTEKYHPPLRRNSSRIIYRAKLRSVKMSAVIVTAFILCWSPVTFNMVLILYRVIPGGGYFYILMAMAPLNSVVNPIIYLTFNYRMLIKQYEDSKASIRTNYTTVSRKESDRPRFGSS